MTAPTAAPRFPTASIIATISSPVLTFEPSSMPCRTTAAWTGRAEEDPPTRIHSAVIFAPAGPLVPEALRVLRKGGVIALAGIYMSPIPSLEYSSIYHERTLRSVANSTRQDAHEILRLAGEIPIRTEIETFALEEANEALLRLKESRVRGAGVLIL